MLGENSMPKHVTQVPQPVKAIEKPEPEGVFVSKSKSDLRVDDDYAQDNASKQQSFEGSHSKGKYE